MQQKVAIARALLTSPSLLLLDEPTTGLDPRSKLDVQTFIEEMRDTHDTTIVLTTHDLDEAARLCSRVAILDGGRVVASTADRPHRYGGRDHGLPPTLESVFMFTGRSLDDDIEDRPTIPLKEVMTMQQQAFYQLRLAKRRQAQFQAAADARLPGRRDAPSAPIRRALGDRIIAIGNRIAVGSSRIRLIR
jgi:ABC-type multidrug transport system ATPase subunit